MWKQWDGVKKGRGCDRRLKRERTSSSCLMVNLGQWGKSIGTGVDSSEETERLAQ